MADSHIDTVINLILNEGTVRSQLLNITQAFETMSSKISGMFNFRELNNIDANLQSIANTATKFNIMAESIKQNTSLMHIFGQETRETLTRLDNLGRILNDYRSGKGLSAGQNLALSQLGINIANYRDPNTLFTDIIKRMRTNPNRTDSAFLQRALSPFGLYNSATIRAINASEEDFQRYQETISRRSMVNSAQLERRERFMQSWRNAQDAITSGKEYTLASGQAAAETLSPLLNSFANIAGRHPYLTTAALYGARYIRNSFGRGAADSDSQNLKNIADNTATLVRQGGTGSSNTGFRNTITSLAGRFFGDKVGDAVGNFLFRGTALAGLKSLGGAALTGLPFLTAAGLGAYGGYKIGNWLVDKYDEKETEKLRKESEFISGDYADVMRQISANRNEWYKQGLLTDTKQHLNIKLEQITDDKGKLVGTNIKVTDDNGNLIEEFKTSLDNMSTLQNQNMR